MGIWRRLMGHTVGWGIFFPKQDVFAKSRRPGSAPGPLGSSDPATSLQIKEIQEFVGSLLYYARALDSTMLPAVQDISSRQSVPTQDVVAAVDRLLGYCFSHPDHELHIRPSHMLLQTQSDASYLSLPRSGSKSGGHHTFADHDPDTINAPIDVDSSRIPITVSSAADSEFCAACGNARSACFHRSTARNIGYPQPPTVPLFFVITNVPSAWPTALSKPNGPSRWTCASPGSVIESPTTNSICPTAHPQNYLPTSILSLYLYTATKKWPPSLYTNPVSIMYLYYSIFFLYYPIYIWPLYYLPISICIPILPGVKSTTYTKPGAGTRARRKKSKGLRNRTVFYVLRLGGRREEKSQRFSFFLLHK